MEQLLNNHEKRKVDKEWEVPEPWPSVPRPLSYVRPHVIMAYTLNQNLWAWFCVQQWSKCRNCWNSSPPAPVQASVCPDGNIAVSAEHVHWFELEGNIPRANSDPWLDVSAVLHSRVQAVQHGLESQGISTTEKFKAAFSWQEHDRSVFSDSERVIHLAQWMHSITVTCFAMMCPGWCGINCQRRSSYCITPSSKFDEGNTGNNGLRNHEWRSLQPCRSPQWFSFVLHWSGQEMQTDDELKLKLAMQSG
jgi:hypothetical protein